MFPVLVRINNTEGLLKPGMNTEVNIAVGSASGVLAVPNAALRTERDVASAASVLGIADADLKEMLATAKAEFEKPAAGDSTKGAALSDSGRKPAGDSAAAPSREQMMALFQKQRSGQTLTAEEQALMAKIRSQMGGGRNGGRNGGRGGQGGGSQDALFGGKYIVFAMRAGKPTPVYVQTGITDLDYSEVKRGLTTSDSVLLLPSASLIQAQQGLQERMSRNSGLPGQSTSR
jgi:HlyD family secretion protein